MERLRSSDAFAWYVFRAEWATNCAVYLLEFTRRGGYLYLFPRPLRTWIQRVGTRAICQGPGGVDEAAVRDLDDLLTLSAQVVSVAGLRARLLGSGKRRKDRGSFVRARFESRDGVWAVLVDEDLAPLDLPYSSDVLEGREFLGVQDENADQSDGVVPAGPSGFPGAR